MDQVIRMKWLTTIIEIGVLPARPPQEQRAIILSNTLALILAAVNVILFLLIRSNHNVGALRETIIAVAIFTLPLVFNYFHAYTASRLYLCWAPPVYYTWFILISMQQSA